MLKKIAIFSMLIAAVFGNAVLAGTGSLEDLARAVLQGSPEEAAQATTDLRQAGPAGMETMLALAGTSSGTDALDRVCGVRDCADIRLFWYTDLEAAKAAARATGKPILSLRLMGRLDEELSCANSRFFRTVFYKNQEINDLLRDRFVLHWRSVRPVPKVTIDFGDGSRLERTLTGNSIHYVLDSRGRLIEALPGLYGPEAFQSALRKAAYNAREAEQLDDDQLLWFTGPRHDSHLRDRADAFRRDFAILSSRTPVPAARRARINVDGRETGSKSASERPLLEALLNVDDEQLRELAKLRRPRIHLDADSRAFLLRKHGVTNPKEAERLVDAFETTVALDEVINEYRTGPAILQKLKESKVWKDHDLEAFNLWVYEEVFRTPLSDPWLGLAPEDVYVALPASTRTATPQL